VLTRLLRPALFLLSLALLLATATPTAWGEDERTPSGPRVAVAEVAAMADDPGLSASASERRGDPLTRAIADWHERQGHERWNNGEGDPQYTWALFRRQAQDLRRYLRRAQAEAVHRFGLVVNWSAVARCESSGNWSINTGNGYYGGLQFSLGTWRAYGGEGMPNEQPAWYQAKIADRVRTRSGLHHWPVCGRHYD
jgi:hypothetical protein